MVNVLSSSRADSQSIATNLFDVRGAASARSLRVVLRLFMALCVVMTAPLAWGAQAPTSTALAISSSTVPYQTPIVLTATVTSNNAPVTSGLVLFCDATAPVCENNSALGLAQLTAPGATATLKLGSGPLGVHQYMAVFRANNNYQSSSSNTVSYTVQGTYASGTTISSSGSVGKYALSSTVAGIGSVLSGPTGSVSFVDTSAGNNVLGSGALGTAVLSDTFVAAPNSPFAIATSTTPKRSVAIASAYLDADNNLDVVTGDYSQTITVLLGKGDGSFQPKVNYTGCPSGYAVKIVLADFNRDGNTDVALGCTDGTNGSLTIILGNGDGTFQTPVSYTAGDVAGIALGDFNNDGIFDFAVSNHTQSNVMLFTGNGDGTFNAGVTVLSPPQLLHDVVVKDFNGDGQDDLLYAVNTSVKGSALSDLYLATGTGSATIGTGSFNTPVQIASQVGEFLTAGDVNGDNRPDVISTTITGTTQTSTVGNSLWVVLNQGTSGGNTTFTSTVYQSDIPSDPHLTDVNGDGKPDIIAGGSYGTLVYLGNGNGTFQPYTEPTIGNFALTYAVNAGDFNNDGNADLIGTDAESPRAAVALSQVAQSATAAALTNVALYPLGSGTHQVDASYSGDSIYQASTSSTIPLLAAPTPTTTTLAVSPTSATVSGQTVTLTATVSPYTVGPPTTTSNGDTVNFYNGATLLGSSTVTNGVATLNTTALPVGSDALSASFMGDANYNASQSTTLTVTVTTIVVTSSANPSSYGQSVTFTASLANGYTGSVMFMDGTTSLGASNISGGSATYTTSSLAVGQHNITGVYSGDGSHSGAKSPVLVQTVNQATPVVSVGSSANPSTYGQSVTFTVTVAGATGATNPTGTVTVTSGTTAIGSGSLNSNGVFTAPPISLPTGTDAISVTYSGDSNYLNATGGMNQTVNKATPTLPAPGVNPSSPVTGSPVTITEQVPSGVGGPVTFMNGTTNLGSAPIISGVATLTVPSLPAGSQTITASTPGDTNNNPATSPGTTVNVSKIASTVGVTATGPGTYGATETITATVSPTAATGTVTFTSGSIQLGTGTVASGVASITTTSLPGGTDTVTANYNGDSTYNSSSGSTQVTIGKVASTTTVAVTGAGTYGATETITATVTKGTTGTVTFTSGSTQLGTGTVNTSGIASMTTTSLPAGTDPITANYGGDTNYNSSTGSTSVTIGKASSTTAVAVTGAGTYGATETITATVSPNSATGTVTFTSGSTQLGTGTVNASGIASMTTTSLPLGTDPITANYGGDTNYNPSTGSTSVTIGKSASTTTVAVTGAATYGATETITATVTTGATGTVTFTSGTTALGQGTVSAGTASITTTSLPVGNDPITASYGGDSNYNSSTGSTSVTIGKATPVLPPPGITPNSPVAGSPVTITEAVPPGVGGPVTFTDGTTVLGSAPVTGGTATITVPSLPLGQNTITASTPGDTNNNPATSPGTTVNVAKNASTVNVAASGPGTYGATETITATVSPTGATGTVTFTSGSTPLGTGTVNASGIASITTTALPVGNDPITANYSGDTNYSSGSGTTSVTIAQIIPTVTVTVSGPGVYGSTETITATVPTGATGTITFTSGGTTIGQGAINPSTGTVTVTTATLPVGTDTVTANYSGDTNNAPASGLTTVTISKATPPVTVTSSSNPSTATQPVTFTATVPTTATGTITFTDGSTVIGTVPITNGSATVTTTTLPSGSNTITASYSGDSNDNSNSSQPLTQTVNKNSPVLPPPGVSSTTTDAISPVTITEQVPPGVSGPVTFYDNGTPIGTAPINNGTATITVPSLPVGTDQITASTPGDANNNPATSPATTVTVNKVTPVLPPPSVSNTNPVLGTAVTITETVPSGVTGSVTFSNGGTVIGTAPINNGVATITTSTLPLGSNPITASTQSNATYNAATSPATNVNVAKGAATVTLISSANPAALGAPVTFTATVNQGATGSMTFLDGGTVLGAGVINSAGVATFTTSSLSGGSHTITASFAGDTNFSAATSAPLTQVINKTPTTIVVTESSPMQMLNTSVTFTANVTAPNPTPTGTVTFFADGTAIGTVPMSTNGAVVSLALSGSATYATSALTAGTHQITATYSGDSGFMTSTSLPITDIVADFTNNTKGVTTQQVMPGGATTFTFVLTPVGSSTFLSDTTLTLTGLPQGTTYSFSPAVIAAGSGATTVTLSLTTSTSLRAANHAPQAPSSHDEVPVSLAVLGIFGLGAIRKYRKQMPRLMLAVLLVLSSLLPLAAMSGCAGGYFGFDPTNYNIQVTGTEGQIQHTATTTLVVQ